MSSVLIGAACAAAPGESVSADSSDAIGEVRHEGEEAWQLRVQPAFWLSASSGTLRAGRASDTRTLNRLNLDNPAAAFHLDADVRRADLRFSFEGFYFRDSGQTRLNTPARMFDLTLPANRRLETSFEAWSLAGGAWYRLLAHEAESRHVPGRAMGFDLYAGGGMRVLGAQASVDVSGGPSGSERAIFTQAFLGARAELVISEQFAFTAQADLGTELDDRRFRSVHLMSAVEWRFDENAALTMGYQHLDADVEGGDLRWDGRIAGLYAGLIFTF